MKLLMTNTDGNELFQANVLLPEAWQYSDGTAYIEIDAMDRRPDTKGYVGTIAESLFELHGTKEELREFLHVILAALDEAPVLEKKVQ